jgi:uncharacterized protein (DUF2336 family)
MAKFPKAARLAFAFALLFAAPRLAAAQSPPVTVPAQQAVISDETLDDFGDLNSNLVTLAEKLDKATLLVKAGRSGLGDQRAAFHKSVETLRVAFADGGEVAKLGQAALDFVHAQLAAAQKLTNLDPAQRDAVVLRWRRVAAQTEATIATLEGTRKDLLDKLQLIQAKADFVDEMAELRQARSINDALADLGDRRQSISDRIRNLLSGKTTAPDM